MSARCVRCGVPGARHWQMEACVACPGFVARPAALPLRLLEALAFDALRLSVAIPNRILKRKDLHT